MNKKKVYIETSVVSYLTGNPSQNLIVAAWQSITNEWWDLRKKDFELYSSELVFEEASSGNKEAADKRLEVISSIPLLEITEKTKELANLLITQKILPSKAVDDALHIAIATEHNIDYLLTWNCRHLDNAEIKPIVRDLFYREGYTCPEICTPNELLGDKDEE